MTTSPGVRYAATAALLVASLSLTACEAPQVETEADALVDQLSTIEHVSSVGFAYEDLGGWESDEIEYRIDVAPGADPDTVAEVAAAVYTAVRDDGDVSSAAVSATLHLDDDRLTLRIYQSLAPADDVAEVVTALVPELGKGRTLVEVDTSMREADEPLDLSVNQVLGVRATPAEVQQSTSRWQALIDRVGRGGAYVAAGHRSAGS